jgi:uncharacterized protein YkwD
VSVRLSLGAVLVGAILAGGTSLANTLSTEPDTATDIAAAHQADILAAETSAESPVSGAPGAPGANAPGIAGDPRKSPGAGPTTTVRPPVTTTTTPPVTTTKKPTPTTTTTQPTPPLSQTQQVLQLVNSARSDAGCKALTEDSRLDTAAQDHSDDMGGGHYFSHTTPAGITFDKREEAAGYPSPGGENIAMGQTSAQQVMTDWMNSSGHRANILDCDFVAIGIGLDTNGWYWTQDFGR